MHAILCDHRAGPRRGPGLRAGDRARFPALTEPRRADLGDHARRLAEPAP